MPEGIERLPLTFDSASTIVHELSIFSIVASLLDTYKNSIESFSVHSMRRTAFIGKLFPSKFFPETSARSRVPLCKIGGKDASFFTAVTDAVPHRTGTSLGKRNHAKASKALTSQVNSLHLCSIA